MSQDEERDECRSAPVDDRLRRALDGDPETVRVVVRNALVRVSISETVPSHRWKAWAAATATFVVLVAAIALWPTIRSEHEAPGVPLITNASGELVLVLPDDSDEPASDRPGRADEAPIIFNHSRVIAANVSGLEPRFVVSGGGS